MTPLKIKRDLKNVSRDFCVSLMAKFGKIAVQVLAKQYYICMYPPCLVKHVPLSLSLSLLMFSSVMSAATIQCSSQGCDSYGKVLLVLVLFSVKTCLYCQELSQ